MEHQAAGNQLHNCSSKTKRTVLDQQQTESWTVSRSTIDSNPSATPGSAAQSRQPSTAPASGDIFSRCFPRTYVRRCLRHGVSDAALAESLARFGEQPRPCKSKASKQASNLNKILTRPCQRCSVWCRCAPALACHGGRRKARAAQAAQGARWSG